MRVPRAAALAALVVLAAVAVLTVHEVAVGRREVAAADDAAARSDWPEAVAHARAAAEAIAPGSPWPERGRQRLEAIGHDAEARGDDATAMLAYGAMRSAALATRAPGTGSERLRAKAEEGLARVAASQRPRDLGAPRTSSEAMLDALRENEPPAAWRLALLAAAGLAMLGGVARLAWVGGGGGAGSGAVARARAGSGARAGLIAQGVAAAGAVVYAIVLLLD